MQRCFDFHVCSEIELPELAPARSQEERTIVEVKLGKVPLSLTGAEAAPYHVQWDGHRALIVVPAVARYLIEGARRIVVEPLPEARTNAIRLFLLGSAMGVLGHLRGLLLLHANAVVVNGRVHAFAGDSGAGKSTLAGRFVAAGYPLLSDDVCAVRFTESGIPMAWPGIPRLKLWEDAASWLGHSFEGYERVHDDSEKYSVPMEQASLDPLPLVRFYELERADGAGSTERLAGRAAMRALMAHTYRHEYLSVLGLAGANFALCARLAAAIDMYTLHRRWGFEAFDSEFARLCRHFEAPAE